MSHPSASYTHKSASLMAAAKAVAQINAQLAAEGKLQSQDQTHSAPLVSTKKEKKIKCGRKDLFNAEVEINDLPQKIRNLLTKGYIQEQIQWKSKAALCTKGRYIPPQEKKQQNDEKSLYICVQAVEKAAVDNAVEEIKKFIKEHTATGFGSVSAETNMKNGNENYEITLQSQALLIRDKVYINLDHAPPAFKLLERVLGPSGDNINYIHSETGVSVTIQGQGYTQGIVDEPLHLLLEYSDAAAVQNARVLALSLVGTLQQDYILWQREQSALQQQQHQHIVYTLSQPYYQESSSGSGSCQYPALAMIYDVSNAQGQRAASVEQQSVRASTQRDLPTKRLSRFDLPQITGSKAAHDGGSHVKRPKLAYPSNN